MWALPKAKVTLCTSDLRPYLIKPNNLSIFFLNRCYWPDSEATGQLLTELCEFLAPRWDVTAVVGQPNWDTENEGFVLAGIQERNGVRIHRLLHSKLPKGQRFARIRNLISFTLAVRKWGKQFAKQVRQNGSSATPLLVCETDPFLLPLVVGPLARKTKSRVVYYLQDIYPDVAVAVGVSKNNFFIRMLRSRLKNEYLKADAIVVLDEDMRDRLVGWGLPAERMKIVPNWMDCSVVRPIKSNNSFRIEQKLSDRFVVMHSGNMGMTQRLDVLVDAMRLMSLGSGNEELSKYERSREGHGSESRTTLSRTTLMLVGNGAKRASLEEHAHGLENVRFLDYQPREKLSESLSAADLHVVSMDQAITGCLAPSKLYGILASGTPVLAIVPKGNAVWRLVEQEKLGWTVEPGDTAAIAKAIHEAESLDRKSLAEMGQRGRVLAEKLFDKRICCEAFEDIIKQTAEPKLP